MNSMFAYCYLKNISFNSLFTKNVTNMNYMFLGSTFDNIDFSGFYTNIVKNMEGMFEKCNFLNAIDFSHFNTSKVVSTDRMSMDAI